MRVSSLKYFHACDFDCLTVRETLPSPDCTQNRKLNDWSDDELRRIHAALSRVTASRIFRNEDAEDIVQETFLTMTVKCPQETLEKGLLAWSMGILRNKVGNHYRKVQHSSPWNDNIIPACDDCSPAFRDQSPEARVRHSELRELIEQILEKFEPGQRRAMTLLLEGTPAAEIAQALHPEKYQTVITQLYRGRNKLARELAKHGYGNGKRIKQRSR
jgi:RNA polymerase sigma factor (sigma-70 family)